jgi:hypothetical protein
MCPLQQVSRRVLFEPPMGTAQAWAVVGGVGMVRGVGKEHKGDAIVWG